MAKNAIISRTYENHTICYTSDGWFNATEAAAKFGKKPAEWMRLPETVRYLEALHEMYGRDKSYYVKTKRGTGAGTLIREDLILNFCIWLDSKALIIAAKHISSIREITNALNDFEAPADCPDLYVYLIKNTISGNIKLGISRNPHARLKQLQTGNDCKLELVAYKKAENRFEDEASIHKLANEHHIHGEWFKEGANEMFINH
jgi:hypothetical protein